MEPIISPWFFYLVDVCNSLKAALGIIVGIDGLSFWAALFAWFITIGDEPVHSKASRAVKFSAIIGVVCTVLAVIIPREDTLYKMMASYLITPDNIVAVQDNVVEFVGKIADAIREGASK